MFTWLIDCAVGKIHAYVVTKIIIWSKQKIEEEEF